MLNKEIYKHKLEDVLVKVLAVSKNGEICRCEDIAPCEKCIFYGGDYGDCVENTKKWLNAECKGTAMLTEEEKSYFCSRKGLFSFITKQKQVRTITNKGQ